ncbi:MULTISPECIES: stage II sporulation protein R [Clostridium]|jgi:stage II sporulation protein R|uniref:Stage II sporulation protein R n=1 Tax=Clostridium disporicum TaxID=84024 RepID=A0A174FY48_9CLOT|nr:MULTISPECIES: stage II sporulation protein R [Clostridium]MCD2501475.1 stage II sporulation protein R [Clostridium sp. NSJ-145]CUO53025.1 stage II sporulation protein R [Clostridium disporicum]
MKKNMFNFIIIVFIVTLFGGCSLGNNEASLDLRELNYEEVADKLIRFHVIANSDSEEDQALKLKVRDKIIDKMSIKLESVESLDDAREILNSSIEEVNSIAKEVIAEEGFDYDVKTMLSNENFPDKIYGDYIFPQGNYEAYRVIIGSGEGQNWWCVMFPPLCFVDESKNIVDTKKLDENIANIEGKTEENKKDNDKQVIFKFKVVEVFDKIFN